MMSAVYRLPVVLIIVIYFTRQGESIRYQVITRISNDWYSGTNANVCIEFRGRYGNSSWHRIGGSHERGDTNHNDVYTRDVGPILSIGVKRDNSGFNPDWKTTGFEVRKGSESYRFPCHCWIGNNNIRAAYSCNGKGTGRDACNNHGTCEPYGRCSCDSYYYLKYGTCIRCPHLDHCSKQKPCISASDMQCITCYKDYYLVARRCKRCPRLDHCSKQTPCTSTSNMQCITCDEEYYLVAHRCKRCPRLDHCSKQTPCTSASNMQCITCDEGYYLAAHRCKKCPSPVAGAVHEGSPDGPDIDYTSEDSVTINMRGFIDHDSCIRFYLVALAERCLTFEEMTNHNHTKSSSVHKTINPIIKLTFPNSGLFFSSVVAFNNAMEPSRVVCSDGITKDTTPPLMTDIILRNGQMQRGLWCKDGKAWYVDKNMTLIELRQTHACQKKCKDKESAGYIDALPTKEKTVTGNDISENLCSSLSILSNETIIYLPSDIIYLTWKTNEAESQIRDYFIGIGDDISQIDAPSLMSYESTHGTETFQLSHSGFTGGYFCFIFLKSINKADLTSVVILGPVVIDDADTKLPENPIISNYTIMMTWYNNTILNSEETDRTSVKPGPTVQEGSVLKITCEVVGENPPVSQVIIQLDGVNTNTTQIQDGSVVGYHAFKVLRKFNNHTCQCLVIDQTGRYHLSRAVSIAVNYAPVVKVYTEFDPGTLKVICEAVGRPALYHFFSFTHWGHHRIRELEGDLVAPDKYVLTIRSSTYRDAGRYQCGVTNGMIGLNHIKHQTGYTSTDAFESLRDTSANIILITATSCSAGATVLLAVIVVVVFFIRRKRNSKPNKATRGVVNKGVQQNDMEHVWTTATQNIYSSLGVKDEPIYEDLKVYFKLDDVTPREENPYETF